MKHDEFFRKHPCYRADPPTLAFPRWGRRSSAGSATAYHQAGRVVRIRRGLYAVVPPGADAGSYPIDPFLIASKLTPDSLLSHHTALEFHGKAYSVHTHLTYSTSQPPEPLTFRSHVFKGTRFPRALLRERKAFINVLIAERRHEATGLNLSGHWWTSWIALSGSWEIWRSLGPSNSSISTGR